MKDIIKTILYEWKKKRIPVVIDRDVNLFEYINLKPEKVVALTGFRRVGKTYLMFNLINNLLKEKTREEVIYINFEDERIPLKTDFLTLLIPTIKEVFDKKTGFIFLDEIQNVPDWSKWIRRLYDNEDIKIIVSGSSSKMSSKEIPTELRGRFIEIKLFPLSFKEFLRFKNLVFDFKSIIYSKDERALLLKYLNQYLEYGGLPEIVISDDKKTEIAHSYYQTVVRRDIVERYKIKNEEALKALLMLLINSTYYSISKLYNSLKSMNYEIGKTTIQKYLSYIENSYFMINIPIFSYKVKEQIQYPRKVYFIDNVFISILSNRNLRGYGRFYENIVAINLMRLSKEIFYWKNQQKEEVDFVIKEGLKIKELIQVCYDMNNIETKKREIRALLKASKELKCNNLLIITEDYEKEEEMEWFSIKRKIKFIPLWKWLI